MKSFNNVVLEECNKIIEEGLKQEIAETIKVLLEGKYSNDLIAKYIVAYFNNSDDLPEEIKYVGISVSYDMGWQKSGAGII